MVEPTMNRYAEALLDQTDQLAALVAGVDLDRQVPSCPEWDLHQLVGHIGQAHRFGAELVRRRVHEPGEVSAPTTIPVPDDAAELGEWLIAGARELVDAVQSPTARSSTGQGALAVSRSACGGDQTRRCPAIATC